MTDLSSRLAHLSMEQRLLFEKRIKMQQNKLAKIKQFILTIQEGDPQSTIPLFALHPAIGAIGYMRNLARHLAPDQPFYGIQSPAYSGTHSSFSDMEEMAQYYMTALTTFEDQGTFILLGHSSGAYIAYEMALQLERQGFRVPLLMVIDELAPIPGHEQPIMEIFKTDNIKDSVEAMYLTAWAVSLAHAKKLPFTIDELRPLNNTQRYERIALFLKEAGFIPASADSQLVGTILEMYANHYRADSTYKEKWSSSQPDRLYTGHLVLFRSTLPTIYEGCDITDMPDQSPASEWDKFCCGQIDVIGIQDANHITMIIEPAVKNLALQIQPFLNRYARK